MPETPDTVITGGGRGSGVRELIFRGERTNPKAVMAQTGAFALAGALMTWLIVAIIMVWVPRPWAWLGDHWRWPVTISLVSGVIGAAILGHVMFIESYDPMHPGARQPLNTSKPVFPWTKEKARWPEMPAAERLPDVESYDLDS